jgi:hypothetical protein
MADKWRLVYVHNLLDRAVKVDPDSTTHLLEGVWERVYGGTVPGRTVSEKRAHVETLLANPTGNPSLESVLLHGNHRPFLWERLTGQRIDEPAFTDAAARLLKLVTDEEWPLGGLTSVSAKPSLPGQYGAGSGNDRTATR